jgi:hypothetical protein
MPGRERRQYQPSPAHHGRLDAGGKRRLATRRLPAFFQFVQKVEQCEADDGVEQAEVVAALIRGLLRRKAFDHLVLSLMSGKNVKEMDGWIGRMLRMEKRLAG